MILRAPWPRKGHQQEASWNTDTSRHLSKKKQQFPLLQVLQVHLSLKTIWAHAEHRDPQQRSVCCGTQGHALVQRSAFVPPQAPCVNQRKVCWVRRTLLLCPVFSMKGMWTSTWGAPRSAPFCGKEVAKIHLTWPEMMNDPKVILQCVWKPQLLHPLVRPL